MRGAKTLIAAAVLCGVLAAQEPPAHYLEAGRRAYALTERVVEIGPRPAGSAGQKRQQDLILRKLAQTAAKVEEDSFTSRTPLGPRPMKNIVARFAGESGRVIAVSGHYDTYHRPGLENFVGANDGGSSTGLLLALAERLSKRPLKDSVWLVFFDGEESTVAWRDGDHTYGSRRLAERWKQDGTREKVKALINVDMIGDKDLRLSYEGNSTAWLRELVWETARRLGYEREFPSRQMHYVEDDHVPFLERGFAAVNLIDFDYGLFNRYWHTGQDTMDKLSPRSFAVILHVIEESLKELETRP